MNNFIEYCFVMALAFKVLIFLLIGIGRRIKTSITLDLEWFIFSLIGGGTLKGYLLSLVLSWRRGIIFTLFGTELSIIGCGSLKFSRIGSICIFIARGIDNNFLIFVVLAVLCFIVELPRLGLILVLIAIKGTLFLHLIRHIVQTIFGFKGFRIVMPFLIVCLLWTLSSSFDLIGFIIMMIGCLSLKWHMRRGRALMFSAGTDLANAFGVVRAGIS